MKLIKPEVVNITQKGWDLNAIYKQVELAGRVAYKSEDRITEDSAKPFVDMLMDRQHLSVLEHGTVYLTADRSLHTEDFYEYNPYSVVRVNKLTGKIYVTTNLRVIAENSLLEDLKYLSERTGFHSYRKAARIICSIGIGREILRHRRFSFTQESTRYCNYGKDKFNKELTFIKPSWYDGSNPLLQESLNDLFAEDEKVYMNMLKNGKKPEQAREILPLATKTEIIMTGFVQDWDYFIKLRTGLGAHPDMKAVATLIKESI